jgi:galactokinase
MVGGGFGGSVIALVPAGSAAVSAALSAEYARRGWAPPLVLAAPPSAGASRIW